MEQKPWKKLAERCVYKGWRDMLVRQFEMPDGKMAAFDVVRNGNYITLAAFTPQREAILVRQFRPGPEQFLWSFPEGYIDRAESPEQAARRELLEETGYLAGEVQFLKKFYRAYSTEERTILLATGCVWQEKPKGDEHEFLEITAMPFGEFRKFICDPQETAFTNTDAAYLALEALRWL